MRWCGPDVNQFLAGIISSSIFFGIQVIELTLTEACRVVAMTMTNDERSMRISVEWSTNTSEMDRIFHHDSVRRRCRCIVGDSSFKQARAISLNAKREQTSVKEQIHWIECSTKVLQSGPSIAPICRCFFFLFFSLDWSKSATLPYADWTEKPKAHVT